MRKFIPVSPETHAKLTREIAKAMLKNKGKRVTFDQLINKLI